MALSLAADREKQLSRDATELAMLLACAAWNSIEAPEGVERAIEGARQFSAVVWAELRSSDPALLMRELIQFRQSRHAKKGGVVLSFRVSEEGIATLEWIRTGEDETEQRPIEKALLEKLVPWRGTFPVVDEMLSGRAPVKEGVKDHFPPETFPYHFTLSVVDRVLAQYMKMDQMLPIFRVTNMMEALLPTAKDPDDPVLRSYLAEWAGFDAAADPGRETVGSVTQTLGEAFEMEPQVLHCLRSFNQSRRSIHVHEGFAGDLVRLREIAGKRELSEVMVEPPYKGREGEVWYGRVLPPAAEGMPSVMLSAPYVLLEPDLAGWRNFIERTTPASLGPRMFEVYMKYGPFPTYWLEYIRQTASGQCEGAGFLAGIPNAHRARYGEPRAKRASVN
ncbi:MAG: hypothetical protein FJW39_20940 [Acidobacteria bacterium]|nr:hypothetical protein [Acidobacteriota bacterium]